MQSDINPDAEKGEEWYQRTYWVHYNVGPEDTKVVCPQKTLGGKYKCPICEEVEALSEEYDKNKKEISNMKAKERELYNVVDLDDKKKPLKLLEISYHNFGKQLDKEMNKCTDEEANFDSLMSGMSLKVRFDEESTGGNQTYLKAGRIDFEKREDQYDEKMLEEVIKLDDEELLIIHDYETIEKMFLGEDLEEEAPANEPESTEPESTETEEPPPEEKKPRERTRTRTHTKPSEGENECPYNHTFGTDNDSGKDCEKCEDSVWEKCSKKYDELKK